MGSNPEVAFTESDEDSNVKDGIRGQLPELHPVNKEQPTEEFMDCNSFFTSDLSSLVRSLLQLAKGTGFPSTKGARLNC